MHRPDRIGALVLAFILFSLYIDTGSILNSLSLASLPLVGSGTVARVQVLLFSTAVMNSVIYYKIRQGKHAARVPAKSR